MTLIRRRTSLFREDLLDCYSEELTRTPSLAGVIQVRYVIGVDGSVVDATIGSLEPGSDDLHKCMLRVFARLTFGKMKDGKEVNVDQQLHLVLPEKIP